MASEWRQRIYNSYMSNGFRDSHSMRDEFALHAKYFKKNYLRFMPKDKDCKILELGCGMGQFYFFCKTNGYENYVGIDASSENISFIKSWDKQVEVREANILSFIKQNKNSRGGTTLSYLMM